MSWIKLKCASDILKGDVLAYDANSNYYVKASNMNTPVYVAMNDAIENANTPGTYHVKGQVQGQVLAKASRNIAENGGFIAVENGGVYVDNNMNSCGIIWHNFIDAPPRVAGDLVTITLR